MGVGQLVGRLTMAQLWSTLTALAVLVGGAVAFSYRIGAMGRGAP